MSLLAGRTVVKIYQSMNMNMLILYPYFGTNVLHIGVGLHCFGRLLKCLRLSPRRAYDGPTLNAGFWYLCDLSGDPDQYCYICDFSGGVRTPAPPPLDPPMKCKNANV